MKKYYTYDRLTSAFIGSGDAEPSPLEFETYFLPAWATFVEPPVTPIGKTAYFVDGGWVLLDTPPAEAMATVVGWMATPDEKAKILLDIAQLMFDSAAQSQGFVNMADALTWTVPLPQTQRQWDANALRDWRVAAIVVVDIAVHKARTTTDPLPTPQAFVATWPKLERHLIPVPNLPPANLKPWVPLTEEQLNYPDLPTPPYEAFPSTKPPQPVPPPAVPVPRGEVQHYPWTPPSPTVE